MTSQTKILEWLQARPGWHACAEMTKAGLRKQTEGLNQLLKQGDVEKRRTHINRPVEWGAI